MQMQMQMQLQYEQTNPLPPAAPPPEASREAKGSGKAAWMKAHSLEVVKATAEISAIWPNSAQGDFQPDGQTLVPGVSTSELAGRLGCIRKQGASLAVCVEIAKRAVAEWRAGKWIKAPQYFFGKAKDAPFHAYYQAHVTNAVMRETH